MVICADDGLRDSWASIIADGLGMGRPMTPADAWVAAPAVRKQPGLLCVCASRLDDHAPPAAAVELNRRRIDALTAKAAGLRNTPDTVILERSQNGRRVVVMFGTDYVKLHALGLHHTGIAYVPNAPQDVAALVNALILLDGVRKPDAFSNWLEHMSNIALPFTDL